MAPNSLRRTLSYSKLQLRGPLVFSPSIGQRDGLLQQGTTASGTVNGTNSYTTTCDIHDRVSGGAVWEAFSVTMKTGLKTTDMIAKLVCPPMYPAQAHFDGWGHDELFGGYDEPTVRRAINTELGLYAGELACLQGRAVPTLFSIFAGFDEGEEDVWMVLMENAGAQVDPEMLTALEKYVSAKCLFPCELTRLPRRIEIISHYHALHSAGVLHCDPEPKHWLQHHPNGPIRIIDFERSKRSSDMTAEEWEKNCKWELVGVLAKLKLYPNGGFWEG